MGIKFGVWLVILFILSLNSSCLGCSEEEKTALLHLKANINFPNGGSFPSWLDSDTKSDCCQWKGVGCNNYSSQVIELNLESARNRRLSGDWYFNASMFLHFKELKNLSLSYNNIVGWIANEGFDKLLNLRNLVALDLSYNSFDQSVLSSLSMLSSLKHLNLAGCYLDEPSHGHEKLTGLKKLELLDFSYSYGINDTDIQSVLNLNDFVSLKELYLGHNEFRSFGAIHGLKNLEVLDISYNHFNTSIFSSLQGLLSLKYLYLPNNKIEGSIQIDELQALNNLAELDLSDNPVTSFVASKEIKSRHGLQVLRLGGEHLSGNNFTKMLESLRVFPNLKNLHLFFGNTEGVTLTRYEFRHLRQLEGLFLDYFSVDQNFLESIGVVTSLKYLRLRGCKLNGTLPNRGWCELKHLEELDISDNEFEGKLPSCLGNMTTLRIIDLTDNNFVGNIASSPITSLLSLELLYLSWNNFQVPLSFGSFYNHSNLRRVFAEGNEIVAGTQLQNWIPSFELEEFVLSDSTATGRRTTLPNFLWYQSQLRWIDLSDNNLELNFPTWLLENNTKLEQLSLNNNALKGPVELPVNTNLNLVNFKISNNNLSGAVPSHISSVFPNLVSVYMSRNVFDGRIPSSFGDLKSLKYLDLSNNRLSGKLPHELFTACFSLLDLRLSNNNMQGEIFPNAINILSQLELLYLDGNDFSGTIPNTIFISTLWVLDISNNRLRGKIPRSVGNLTYLLGVNMSNNYLGGSIPAELCKLQWIELLELSKNNFVGSVPLCFSTLTQIRHVYLNNNHLDGQLPYAFHNSSSLRTLDLRENTFTGSIPQWISNMSNLQAIMLRGNNFEGAITHQLCLMEKLSIIDLSHNSLSGNIPSCLGNLAMNGSRYIDTSFVYKYYALRITVATTVAFETKGNYYSYTGSILNLMSGIDLASNKLYGQIPSELGKLTEIHSLNLSNNNLSGTIPTTFSSMSKIESLDLSYNNLGGRIPAELTRLNSLGFFSVAHNNLSGMIPDKGHIATFDERSYEGNAFLCGGPLPTCGSVESRQLPPTTSDEEMEESSFLDMESFYASFVVTYVWVLLVVAAILYINPYWRKA